MGHRAQRRLQVLAAVVVVAVTTAVAAGCAGSASAGGSKPGAASAAARSSAQASAPSASPSPASPSPSASPWPLVVAVPSAEPGQHQTTIRPTAHDPVFEAEMTDLWAGIVSGHADLAMPAFFPLVAYEQIKAIADPAGDWHNRLVLDFREDVVAAHNLIGSQARQASLVEVIVPEQAADWIYPGVCANSVGYWHVANARMVYRVDGRIMSFGIATLISWRGRWYVVHLGGELRTSYGGMVDQPASGTGVPGPPGGC